MKTNCVFCASCIHSHQSSQRGTGALKEQFFRSAADTMAQEKVGILFSIRNAVRKEYGVQALSPCA
ncbi:hypothetical protein, partial [Anaerotignum lactatifermentans]|uniref:hypothetical protein n=1 Tax=Anaerotignum lactatifermentans TaxID=160404 RepID=UPI003AB4171D